MADDRTLTQQGGSGAQLIGGRYELWRKLGEGGMGEVFEAFDHKLHRRMALKRPPREAWLDLRARKGLLDEARLQASLGHPHIVSVQDVIDEGAGRPVWVVMGYVEGRSLKDVVLSRGRLEPAEAAGVALQMAQALGAAHDAGVVHRDVKPSNIMVDRAGWVYVLDFGVARLVQQTMVTLTGQQTSGTPLYMAPEQHIGGRAAKDRRVDVFAFGCVLYEMLAGEAPFAEAADPLLAKERRGYESPGDAVAGLPPGLCELIDRCLEPDPAKRIADFGEVEKALRAAVPDARVPDRPALKSCGISYDIPARPAPLPEVPGRVPAAPDAAASDAAGSESRPVPSAPPPVRTLLPLAVPSAGMARPTLHPFRCSWGAVVTSSQALLGECGKHPEEAAAHLYDEHIERWLRYYGDDDLARQAAEIRQTCPDRRAGIWEFVTGVRPFILRTGEMAWNLDELKTLLRANPAEGNHAVYSDDLMRWLESQKLPEMTERLRLIRQHEPDRGRGRECFLDEVRWYALCQRARDAERVDVIRRRSRYIAVVRVATGCLFGAVLGLVISALNAKGEPEAVLGQTTVGALLGFLLGWAMERCMVASRKHGCLCLLLLLTTPLQLGWFLGWAIGKGLAAVLFPLPPEEPPAGGASA